MKSFKVGQTWRTDAGYSVDVVCVYKDGRAEVMINHPGHRLTDDGFMVNSDGKLNPTARYENHYSPLTEQVVRVYIAGPIGQRADKNRPAFDAAAALYRGRGCHVINPLDIVPEGSTHAEAMRIDLAALLTCDMIVLLPGWENSKGASAEWRVAEMCGLDICYLES